MHAVKVLESHHFEVNGLDYYEPLSKEMTQGVSVRCVLMHKPLQEHSHADGEQVYYIRSGRGIMKIDDEEQEVVKDMVIYIPQGASHSMTPLDGDETSSYIFFNHYF